ncbi:hypothetical protein AAG747_20535 [Rapidithrix thailandica]|uniref:Uncharacterized protein n=1 Tax=Rapidithrix thailandica TaxID=413964 RepID=A0AAW9RZK2_9BACT
MADQDKDRVQQEEGNVDWESLEKKSERQDRREEEYDEEKVKDAVKNLSEEEKSMPYPDDFLADINLLMDEIKESRGGQLYSEEDHLDEEE